MAEDFHRHVLGQLLGVVCIGAARQNHAVFMMGYLQVADGPPEPDLQPRFDSMDQFGSEGGWTSAGLIMHVFSFAAFEESGRLRQGTGGRGHAGASLQGNDSSEASSTTSRMVPCSMGSGKGPYSVGCSTGATIPRLGDDSGSA
jgi:hypothetical protein